MQTFWFELDYTFVMLSVSEAALTAPTEDDENLCNSDSGPLNLTIDGGRKTNEAHRKYG